MPHEVGYSPRARQDLIDLYLYIAELEGDRRALAYSTRIKTFCEKLLLFPERGHRRDDLEAGLRIIGFERRVTIAFHVTAEQVVIDRILYGGRSLEDSYDED